MSAAAPLALYRPQFPFPTIPNCDEEQFHYFYDSTNVAALGNSIPAATWLRDVVLSLQPDAAFLWRGFKVADSGLAIRFRDPSGNYLSSCPIPIILYGDCPIFTSDQGGFCVTFPQGIYCQPGGNVVADFYNPTAGALTPTSIQLHGLKRFIERQPICK